MCSARVLDTRDKRGIGHSWGIVMHLHPWELEELIFDTFHSEGSRPVDKDKLNSLCKNGDRIAVSCSSQNHSIFYLDRHG